MGVTLAIVGNPNVGKTVIFNALTGLSQTTGNYPGVTVERKHGNIRIGADSAVLVDLPGTYSLAARSPDEIIVVDVLLDQFKAENQIDGLVVVADASNLERNLYLVSQLIELGKPVVLALNMMDIAKRRKLEIRHDLLAERLGAPVVPICAHSGTGLDDLRREVARLIRGEIGPPRQGYQVPPEQQEVAAQIAETLRAERERIGRAVPPLEIQRILVDRGGYAEKRLVRIMGPGFSEQLESHRASVRCNGSPLATIEARGRYAWVKEVLDGAVAHPAQRERHRSERIDNVLTHKVFGTFFFFALMLLVFQSIYSGAEPLMNFVDSAVAAVGGAVSGLMPAGMLQSLVTDGIIAGVGAVLVFLPQILLLSLFIAILEDCGYMARAAFLLDKLLGFCGLSGQSFIPMLSSFACAIPGIMATRTIHNRRDRFTTILVAPLMSCSARLPVYMIMIAAFIPEKTVLGFINLHGMTLFMMYLLGIFVAVPVAWAIKRFLFRGEKPPFLLEMPSYKVPKASTVLTKVYHEGKEFVVRAGTLICAVTILVWALAYFPRSADIETRYEAQRQQVLAQALAPEARDTALAELEHLESGEYLRTSLLGRAGHAIEPVFRPLGWDWRIATATLASFPAREIIVATLGTLFNMGADEDENSQGLLQKLRTAQREDGSLLFNVPVALSIMVFFALCCQCAATLVTIRRETGQWRWPVLTFGYMTVLAYGAAFATYQTTMLLGWGAFVQ